jgi:hypothetical protein
VVRFDLPGQGNSPVTVTGVVRWVAPNSFAAGIQFKFIPVSQKSRFERWLDGEEGSDSPSETNVTVPSEMEFVAT